MAIATSGWIPTTRVRAPRSRALIAIPRSARATKESITSSAETSMMTLRNRWRPTESVSSSRSCSTCASVRSDWIAAMSASPCRRSATPMGLRPRYCGGVVRRGSEQPLGFLEPTLEVTHRAHLAQVDAEVDERLRDLGREPRDDGARAHQSRRLHGLHEVVGNGEVDGRDSSDVKPHDARTFCLDRAEKLLGELPGPLEAQHADERKHDEPVPHLQHRGGELADRLLLLTDHPLALFHEADAHGDGDAVRRRLVGVEDPVQEFWVLLVTDEERSREHVPQQQDDAQDLVRVDPARDDPLREVPGVGLERLDAAGLERRNVVVVHGGDLGVDLVWSHRRQQVGVGDPVRPLLTQTGAVVAQVADELRKEWPTVGRRCRQVAGRFARGHVLKDGRFARIGNAEPGIHQPAPTPSRKRRLIDAIRSSLPRRASDGPASTRLSSASDSHVESRSLRSVPASCARWISWRNGRTIPVSKSVPARSRSLAPTTKMSPASTNALIARSIPSRGSMSSTRDARSRPTASSIAASRSRTTSVSRVGK